MEEDTALERFVVDLLQRDRWACNVFSEGGPGCEVPLIADQIRVISVLTTINTLQGYVPVMILTGGGPSNASLVPGLYLYQSAFNHDRFGYAAAIGVVMALILVATTLVANRYVRTRT